MALSVQLCLQHMLTPIPERYCFPKILHLASFLPAFTVPFTGKVLCIRLGSLRDTLSCFWNVERLLSGQNENKVFAGCWYTLQLLERNSKCRKIALLGRLRMVTTSFWNFPSDSLKTLALGHFIMGTPDRNNLKVDFYCLESATPHIDVGKPAVQL